MSIRKFETENGKKVTIQVSKRFEFNQYKEFRSAYLASDRDARFKIDLSKVEYMDSSALGMLLLLRDYAGGDDSRIRLSGISQNLGKILHIAGFNNLFQFD